MQFFDRHGSDDGRGHDRVAQQPGQRHGRRLRTQLPAQLFVGNELVAVRLDAAAVGCASPDGSSAPASRPACSGLYGIRPMPR